MTPGDKAPVAISIVFHIHCYTQTHTTALEDNSTIIMVNLPGTRLGAFRAYFFGFFICTSGFLFGYDTGIVGMYPYKHSSSLSLARARAKPRK